MAYKVGRCLLRKRLREVKMTQMELSLKTGIPLQQISDYVNHRRKSMSLNTAKTIATELSCNIDDLYEWVPVERS
ncbi:helix-turn-helix domain-containing protein [Pseudalkalibacillus caeni]|uniref:Helix-turn-helix transcriptional regulator n=1 Tax=Exobacillus caeni TaxID=2574798 RepID=A0A5R9FDQ8_9BACL|nr:helix-turn-helix transcriptional regulator [Pseudalkalibacillus caeni]TLS37775.1 helix-turn-helix transcriptional regulator [Pseudalkalibacillus caeni]